MSTRAAEETVKHLGSSARPLLCAASGNSPLGLYKELVNWHNKGQLDIASWFFLGLDEWVGMNRTDKGSCGFLVDQELILPLKVRREQTCFFDGRTLDTTKECMRVELFIQERGGIKVGVVGLGMNGHIGLNDPGTSVHLRSHVSVLDPQTGVVGQKYFENPRALTHGITLGLATLMDSSHIILVVSGKSKAKIVKRVIEGEMSDQVPGTLLRDHPSLSIYLDSEAAELLT